MVQSQEPAHDEGNVPDERADVEMDHEMNPSHGNRFANEPGS